MEAEYCYKRKLFVGHCRYTTMVLSLLVTLMMQHSNRQTDGHPHTLVDITRAYWHIDNTEPFTWLKQVKTTTCGSSRSRKQCLAKLDKNLMTSSKNVPDPTKNNPGGSWIHSCVIHSCVFRPPSDMVPDWVSRRGACHWSQESYVSRGGMSSSRYYSYVLAEVWNSPSWDCY